MWKNLASFVLRFRLPLLLLLVVVTGVMGYFASKVKLSYEFAKAIPTDNPKYLEYLSFKDKFGDDGNLMVIGIRSDELFNVKNFTALRELQKDVKDVKYVEDVLSIASAV